MNNTFLPTMGNLAYVFIVLLIQHFGGKVKGGAEFVRFISDHLNANSIQPHHTRLQRPKGEAYVERFNRTLQNIYLVYNHFYRFQRRKHLLSPFFILF